MRVESRGLRKGHVPYYNSAAKSQDQFCEGMYANFHHYTHRELPDYTE